MIEPMHFLHEIRSIRMGARRCGAESEMRGKLTGTYAGIGLFK
jgi:hypothetical protein